MKIKRREIRVAPSTEDDKVVRFCPHCLEFEFKEKLGPKILLKGESKPPDYDQWLQCSACGNIYAVRDIQVESEISSDFTATDDPFDIGGSIVGLGNKKRNTMHEKGLQAIRDRKDAEPDEDIKRELRRGNRVTIIEDF